jgi:hypothetical protein
MTEGIKAETLNFQQKIIITLHDNWPLQGSEAAENIFFAGYMIDPQKRFNSSGKKIEIEVYPSAGVGMLTSLSTNKVNDLFKLDYWIRVEDDSDTGRQSSENQRAKIKKAILDVLHDAQRDIEDLDIAIFTRFVTSDEVQILPIILHESIFITGQYYHHLS